MSPADTQLVGSTQGDYRVVAQVGTGSMGHVYDAVDGAGTHVALKVLHKHHQKEFAARFLREGKTLCLLRHPNIVELVDMGELDNGSLYLATELIQGGTLRDLMEQGPIEPGGALAIVRQVLDALEAAHELGVVHRDIKPENIMIAGDVVKVLDFGVAKLLADTVAGLGEANLTNVGFSVFGSALYIAPESVVGKPIDARIDLYSLGAVLYEMLTGKPPYDHPDATELLKLHAFAPVPALPRKKFTPAIEQLVATALAKEPDDRFRSATDMIAAADTAMQSLRTPPPPSPIRAATPYPAATAHPPSYEPTEPRARPLGERLRKKPRYVLAITGVVVVGLIVGIALAMRGVSSTSGAAPPSAGTGEPSNARELLAKGHKEFELGHRIEALGAYERALHAAPSLGDDKNLRANVTSVLDGKDSLASVLALELLAELRPPAHDAIVAYASTGKLADARHRALLLAEREGIAERVDRVPSWSLDLLQTAGCDERKLFIEKLVAANDKRALSALKRVRAVKCVEREATDAIARLEPAP